MRALNFPSGPWPRAPSRSMSASTCIPHPHRRSPRSALPLVRQYTHTMRHGGGEAVATTHLILRRRRRTSRSFLLTFDDPCVCWNAAVCSNVAALCTHTHRCTRGLFGPRSTFSRPLAPHNPLHSRFYPLSSPVDTLASQPLSSTMLVSAHHGVDYHGRQVQRI